ncbi:ABC transporter ATP-binding protein [Nocardioides mesophilus]|uniref:ABC transporter ATP-binding protein n=1 Tax=Nocardioides mesophilus TaxID=433659 RepID=A0A7G9RAA0_9ACTN|nr:ABC transporter ATP-binding protein [Nocardioides mesophilus]QNN52525.1 ABC transporter ATP-binding protein [Nocardioides mesophilus]
MTETYLNEQPQGSTATKGEEPFLVVENLTVKFPTADGVVHAVTDMSYTLEQGSTLGIVGESGSGKSVSSMAIMGLHDYKRTQMSGSIRVGGREIIGLTNNQMRSVRGADVAMIFQDPLSALHPFYSIGAQIAEAYRAHNDVSKSQARTKAIEMLDRVGIPQARSRVDDFPHQFSGGMRQRAMIAMALSNDPKLLIADEPTTALDVTVQAQILDLLQELQHDFNSAIIIITHDLGVVAEMADDVLVMYGGRAVEHGSTKEILTHPEMPYTWGLLSSIPDVAGDTDGRLIPIPGNPPSLLSPPSGCPFHPRCPHRDKVPGDLCRTELPPLEVGARPPHLKRCHLPDPDAVYEAEVLPVMAPDLAAAIQQQDGPADEAFARDDR